MKEDVKAKTIFSVAGGKGGVGKSIFSVALGAVLAENNYRVALVDLDLGAANLHTYLGITKHTASIADFILKKTSSLNDILLDTSVENLRIISGAEFVPGMANPAHWMKLKIIRHVKSLPADYIIIDLGAGVHFNTLDFFGLSDRGIVVTAPEPGAVMNAYSFIKAALFRQLMNVFRKDKIIGPLIESEARKTDEDKKFSLEWFTGQISDLAPDMLPLIQEIEREFCPALIVNGIPEGQKHVLVRNLINLCAEKLGSNIEHTGNLPDIPAISHYLLNIPGFIHSADGRAYHKAVQNISALLAVSSKSETARTEKRNDFTDEEIEQIINFMDGLDNSIFREGSKDAWKLRMYFKPGQVVDFLIKCGADHELFYKQSWHA
jgi:flagellar biosynthesis protein FlhG